MSWPSLMFMAALAVALYFVYLRPRRQMHMATTTGHYASGRAAVDLQKLSRQPAFARIAVPDLSCLRRPTGFFIHGHCPGTIRFSPDSWSFLPRRAALSLGAEKIDGCWTDVIAGEAFFGSMVQDPQLVLYLADGSRFTAQTEDVENLQKMLDALGVQPPLTSAQSSATGLIKEEMKRFTD